MKTSPLEIMDPEAKSIPGFPLYFASKDGTIWSKQRVPSVRSNLARRRLPQRVHGNYLQIQVKDESGKKHGVNIHRLVLLAWRGLPPEGKPYGCHNDGDLNNCNLDNLRWDTATANAEDSRKHGTLSVGSKHPISKVTETQVIEIRSKYTTGETLRALGAIYGLGFPTIWAIVNRKSWKHI